MDILFEEYGNYVIYRIVNFDLKYEPVFKMCFYDKDEQSYFKNFDKTIENLEIIKRNFKREAFEMFNQLGHFKEAPWEDALIEFIKRVDKTDIRWWLTGSCAACIRGISFKPHDIDIMVDAKDIKQIRQLFLDWTVEPIIDTNGWLTKDFGVLFNHARIDIASDPCDRLDQPEPVDCGPYAKNHLEEVLFKGYNVKVPPVELQINANKRRNRIERVKLLEEYLMNQR